jgi:hypothetical protein
MRALLSLASLAVVAAAQPAAAQDTHTAPIPERSRPKYVVSYLLHLDGQPSGGGAWQQPWLTVVLSDSPTQPVNPESYVVLRSVGSGAGAAGSALGSGAISYTTAASAMVELLRDAALAGKPVYAYGRTISVPGPRGRRQMRLLRGVLVSTLAHQVTIKPLEAQPAEEPSGLPPRLRKLPPQPSQQSPQAPPRLRKLPPQSSEQP